jgi:hypothetical protein
MLGLGGVVFLLWSRRTESWPFAKLGASPS